MFVCLVLPETEERPKKPRQHNSNQLWREDSCGRCQGKGRAESGEHELCSSDDEGGEGDEMGAGTSHQTDGTCNLKKALG